RAVVCDREAEARRRARGVLVAEPFGLLLASDLFSASAGLGLHFCLRFHVDSIHSKPGDSLPSRRGALGLPGVWEILGPTIELLLRVRGTVDGARGEGLPLIRCRLPA